MKQKHAIEYKVRRIMNGNHHEGIINIVITLTAISYCIYIMYLLYSNQLFTF